MTSSINVEMPLGTAGCGPFYYIFRASKCMLLIVLSFNIMSSVVLTSLPQYGVLIARDSFLFVAPVITVPCDLHATMFLCCIYYRIRSQHATDSWPCVPLSSTHMPMPTLKFLTL
jgi:hypothetical protein